MHMKGSSFQKSSISILPSKFVVPFAYACKENMQQIVVSWLQIVPCYFWWRFVDSTSKNDGQRGNRSN